MGEAHPDPDVVEIKPPLKRHRSSPSGKDLRDRFAQNTEYYGLAQAVAGRLGMEYAGQLFSYPNLDRALVDVEQEHVAGQFERLRATVDRIKREVTDEAPSALPQLQLPGVAAVPGIAAVPGVPLLADNLQLLGNQVRQIQQSLRDVEEDRRRAELDDQRRHSHWCPKPGGRVGSRNGYSVPLDDYAVPQAQFLAAIAESVADVALASCKRDVDWMSLWNGGDPTVKSKFAELVALAMSESAVRINGKIHDKLRAALGGAKRGSILDLFKRLERLPQGKWRFKREDEDDCNGWIEDPMGAALAAYYY